MRSWLTLLVSDSNVLWNTFKSKEFQAALDAVIKYLPAPSDVEDVKGTFEGFFGSADVNAPFSVRLKLPMAGLWVTTCIGLLRPDWNAVYNPTARKKLRVGQLLQITQTTKG